MKLESYFISQPKNIGLRKLGQLLNTNKLVKLIELVSIFILTILGIKLFISDNESDLIYNQIVVWTLNIVMLVIVFAGIKLRGEGLGHFGFSFKKVSFKKGLKIFLQSIVVFIFATAAFVIGSIIIGNLIGVPESSDLSGYSYLKDNIWMLLVTLCGVYIVASFGEEVIYRAFLINRLSELGLKGKTGKTIVIILSALVFGSIHYSWGVMGIVQTSFMGLALSISYLYLNKRILILILSHAYMDTILMLQVYFN